VASQYRLNKQEDVNKLFFLGKGKVDLRMIDVIEYCYQTIAKEGET
jgi:hypothetical protein